jgi:hypothetical protein
MGFIKHSGGGNFQNLNTLKNSIIQPSLLLALYKALKLEKAKSDALLVST